MNKKIIVTILLVLAPPFLTRADTQDMRIKGLIAASVLVAAGGTYQICKRSDNPGSKLGNLISGVILVIIGAAGIILSSQLIREVDNNYKLKS